MAKRRGNGEGSIYQRKDRRWVGAMTVDGKQRSFYGKTQREAREKLDSARRARASGLPMPSGSDTVGAYLPRWLEEVARPNIGRSTYVNYEGMIRLHLLSDPVARARLTRLTPEAISGLYGRLLEKGLSAATVRLMHKILHRAFKQARRWNLIQQNPVELVDPPTVPRKQIRVLSMEETKRFLAVAEGDRLEALLAIALTTGCR